MINHSLLPRPPRGWRWVAPDERIPWGAIFSLRNEDAYSVNLSISRLIEISASPSPSTGWRFAHGVAGDRGNSHAALVPVGYIESGAPIRAVDDDYRSALDFLMRWIEAQPNASALLAASFSEPGFLVGDVVRLRPEVTLSQLEAIGLTRENMTFLETTPVLRVLSPISPDRIYVSRDEFLPMRYWLRPWMLVLVNNTAAPLSLYVSRRPPAGVRKASVQLLPLPS